MRHVIIENPVINSPFAEPTRHFRFTDDGITNEIVEGKRRISSYFVPIPAPKKKSKQLNVDTEWTQDRQEENKLINRIRGRVSMWRQGNYSGVTRTTSRLLEYWTNPDRDNKLFFCQIEALETIIYITEAARREVLDRLLALNHERYAQEVEMGLHDKKRKKKTATRRRKRSTKGQEELF